MKREKQIWKVTLHDRAGRETEVSYSAYWDSEKVYADEVAKACAIEQSRKVGKEFVGVRAVPVES